MQSPSDFVACRPNFNHSSNNSAKPSCWAYNKHLTVANSRFSICTIAVHHPCRVVEPLATHTVPMPIRLRLVGSLSNLQEGSNAIRSVVVQTQATSRAWEWNAAKAASSHNRRQSPELHLQLRPQLVHACKVYNCATQSRIQCRRGTAQKQTSMRQEML